eukprot:767502-Hanusia_phi.AAC.7
MLSARSYSGGKRSVLTISYSKNFRATTDEVNQAAQALVQFLRWSENRMKGFSSQTFAQGSQHGLKLSEQAQIAEQTRCHLLHCEKNNLSLFYLPLFSSSLLPASPLLLPYTSLSPSPIIFSRPLSLLSTRVVIDMSLSTAQVLPGYCREVANFLIRDCVNTTISYNPEFIAQGDVIRGLLRPDMVLIGEGTKEAGDALEKMYRRMVQNEPE